MTQKIMTQSEMDDVIEAAVEGTARWLECSGHIPGDPSAGNIMPDVIRDLPYIVLDESADDGHCLAGHRTTRREIVGFVDVPQADRSV